jgi:TPP-dependent indolepyruvate ferredoxin oxidoreductase alpha subunit
MGATRGLPSQRTWIKSRLFLGFVFLHFVISKYVFCRSLSVLCPLSLDLCSVYLMQYFVVEFVSDLRQVSDFLRIFQLGPYKVRNEIETKRNETKSTKTKRNETKRNQQKRNETKRKQRNENEIKRNQWKQNEINENKTKYDARLLPTHVSVSFIGRGQDLITIEQEYYAFIQRESVLFT